MTAQIINGKEFALSIRKRIKNDVSQLPAAPCLAVIIAGANPASEIYVHAKEKACQEAGINANTYRLPADISEERLMALIHNLNTDCQINGILVQLPLPKHLNTQKILRGIAPHKDVDGFHPLNMAGLIQKDEKAFIPCTPKGIIKLLHSIKENLSGLHAVVIGRSQIVGLPCAHLLLNENCTVTVAHSKSQNLAQICQKADILVVAAGKTELIDKRHIKPGAIVIDVGINRTPDGLKGDIRFNDALETASYITPVPGGVGPMTIAMLLENTYEAYLKQNRP